MAIAAWRTSLIDTFQVPPEALKSLPRPTVNKLRPAVELVLTYDCDQTREKVYRLLQELNIPSAAIQLEKYRIAHERHVADQESAQQREEIEASERKQREEDQRHADVALPTLKTKFGLEFLPRADLRAHTVVIREYVFIYTVEDNDQVHWDIKDPVSGATERIWNADPGTNLGPALVSLKQKREEWERKQVPEPSKTEPVEPDRPTFTGSYADEDGEGGKGKDRGTGT
jgi:hypothetical protein